MAYNVIPLTKLIEQFERLPGIGRKTAQRLAFYVLNLPREKAQQFADAITEAHDKIKKCRVCQSLTEGELCPICADSARDGSVICVVEDSQDVLAFERTREYHGLYHVLHGLISPMDGDRPRSAPHQGAARAHRFGRGERGHHGHQSHRRGGGHGDVPRAAAKADGVRVTRLAYGIPVGGNLEYADEVTLYRALEGRSEI